MHSIQNATLRAVVPFFHGPAPLALLLKSPPRPATARTSPFSDQPTGTVGLWTKPSPWPVASVTCSTDIALRTFWIGLEAWLGRSTILVCCHLQICHKTAWRVRGWRKWKIIVSLPRIVLACNKYDHDIQRLDIVHASPIHDFVYRSKATQHYRSVQEGGPVAKCRWSHAYMQVLVCQYLDAQYTCS